ncbi:hypothetical protein L798_05778 [Zootermopsis nevadensis]|uniref:Uncharacterized protein n=1 Tax=Zootermopsis nevadensis TaxID=136037 RepID=A0A067RHD9_ZOONE|nr:hypothetical protein L798_05778 [Zootermopsis nevadensis]
MLIGSAFTSGYHFALLETKIALVYLLRHFELGTTSMTTHQRSSDCCRG